jgi:acyl-CoA thioester hydrolase
MGVVYYGNYLAFFESARVETMRQIGADYASAVRRGVHIPVVEATVRYRQPAVFDDVLLVRTHAAHIGKARFTFSYEIVREADGALIASGHTVHACVESQTMQPVRIPTWLRQDLMRLSNTL